MQGDRNTARQSHPSETLEGRAESPAPPQRGQWLIRAIVVLALIGLLFAPQLVALRHRPWDEARLRQAERICTEVRRIAPRAGEVPLLVDVTEPLGLHFQPAVGPLGTYFMPEINGAGGALFDFDNDGRLDVYLLNRGRSPKAAGDFPSGTTTECRLFRQLSSGQFEDVTATSGLGAAGYALSCAVGDMDNDGDQDVYVAAYGPDFLFRNNGDGTFTDVTKSAGIDSPGWSSSALFFDYNRDGRLDLFVVEYLEDLIYGHSVACDYGEGQITYCGPRRFTPTASRLFFNAGVQTDDRGQATVRFEDVSAASGIGSERGAGFGAVSADFDGNGWLDLYVAHDTYPNQLWMNRGDGTFTNEAAARGVAVDAAGNAQGSMGIGLGDLNGDQLLDLMVTNVTLEPNTVYFNQGDGLFVDQTEFSRIGPVTTPHTGWGVALVDLDHDADLDVAMVNGLIADCKLLGPTDVQQNYVVRNDRVSDPQAYWEPYTSANQLLINDGKGRFIDGSASGGDFTSTLRNARGLISGDIDEDGDLDLLVTYVDSPARLFRNDIPKSGHWLQVRALDPRWKRDAYGAQVTVAAGTRKLVRAIQPASSFVASNDVRAHFGLGAPDRYDAISVQWPDGLRETFPGGPADQLVVVHRGEGRVSSGE